MPLSFRSLLFVPADDAGRLAAAFSSGADAVVADLEQAAPERKADARRTVEEILPAASQAARLVRVNAVDSGHFAADLDSIASLPLTAIVLPMATVAAVETLSRDGPPVFAIIESGTGVREAFDIASSHRVEALVLGAFDLSADLGLEPRPDALELLYARSKLVVDSAASGIRKPFDRVYPAADDLAGLEADAAFGRSLGFGGKACIDASHPLVVNRVFSSD